MAQSEQCSTHSDATFDTDTSASLAVELSNLRRRLDRASAGISATPSHTPVLAQIAAAFGLTSFERDLLLLCAGVEIDHALAAHVGQLQNDVERRHPSLALALSLFEYGHVSAWSAARPLHRWHLLEADQQLPTPMASLCIDPRILHALAGIHYIEPRLAPLLTSIPPPNALPPNRLSAAEELVSRLDLGNTNDFALLLAAECANDARACAAYACEQLDLSLYQLRADGIPCEPAGRELAARLVERECALAGRVILVDGSASDPHRLLPSFLDTLDTPLLAIGDLPCMRRTVRNLRID